MTRQCCIDGVWVSPEEAAEIREKRSGNKSRSDLPFPMIIADRVEYRSMIDGSMITGRRQHREHLAAHGCIEVGNETNLSTPQVTPRGSIARDIKTAIEQIEAGYQAPPDVVGTLDDEDTMIEAPDVANINLCNVKNGDFIRSDANASSKLILGE